MVKKRVKKQQRRLAFFGTLSLFIICYFLFNLCYYSYRISVLKKSKLDLEIELSTLLQDEELLKTDIQKLKDPEYIAKYAREKYMYSKDGEYIIKIEDKNDVMVKEEDSIDYHYIIFLCFSFLVIIVLYIIKKNKNSN